MIVPRLCPLCKHPIATAAKSRTALRKRIMSHLAAYHFSIGRRARSLTADIFANASELTP